MTLRHKDEVVFMVIEQGGWHLAGELCEPYTMKLLFLPRSTKPEDAANHRDG